LIRFFLSLASVALLLVIGAWAMVDQAWIKSLPSFFFQTLALLLFGTGLLFVYLYRFGQPSLFIQLYLLSMIVKLLAYGAYIFFMIIEDRTEALQNVIWFMLLYFIFTILEVFFLHRKISR